MAREKRTLKEWQDFINGLVDTYGTEATADFHKNYGFLIVDQKPNERGGWVEGKYYSLTDLREV